MRTLCRVPINASLSTGEIPTTYIASIGTNDNWAQKFGRWVTKTNKEPWIDFENHFKKWITLSEETLPQLKGNEKKEFSELLLQARQGLLNLHKTYQSQGRVLDWIHSTNNIIKLFNEKINPLINEEKAGFQIAQFEKEFDAFTTLEPGGKLQRFKETTNLRQGYQTEHTRIIKSVGNCYSVLGPFSQNFARSAYMVNADNKQSALGFEKETKALLSELKEFMGELEKDNKQEALIRLSQMLKKTKENLIVLRETHMACVPGEQRNNADYYEMVWAKVAEGLSKHIEKEFAREIHKYAPDYEKAILQNLNNGAQQQSPAGKEEVKALLPPEKNPEPVVVEKPKSEKEEIQEPAHVIEPVQCKEIKEEKKSLVETYQLRPLGKNNKDVAQHIQQLNMKGNLTTRKDDFDAVKDALNLFAQAEKAMQNFQKQNEGRFAKQPSGDIPPPPPPPPPPPGAGPMAPPPPPPPGMNTGPKISEKEQEEIARLYHELMQINSKKEEALSILKEKLFGRELQISEEELITLAKGKFQEQSLAEIKDLEEAVSSKKSNAPAAPKKAAPQDPLQKYRILTEKSIKLEKEIKQITANKERKLKQQEQAKQTLTKLQANFLAGETESSTVANKENIVHQIEFSIQQYNKQIQQKQNDLHKAVAELNKFLGGEEKKLITADLIKMAQSKIERIANGEEKLPEEPKKVSEKPRGLRKTGGRLPEPPKDKQPSWVGNNNNRNVAEIEKKRKAREAQNYKQDKLYKKARDILDPAKRLDLPEDEINKLKAQEGQAEAFIAKYEGRLNDEALAKAFEENN